MKKATRKIWVTQGDPPLPLIYFGECLPIILDVFYKFVIFLMSYKKEK